MSDVLSRAFDFTVIRSETRDDGLTLEGYAAVFNSPTQISDWSGDYTETIARGAFAKTISERMPVLQFDHGTHPMIGSLPLGVIQKLSEDESGLFVRARLSDNWLVQPVRDAIANGSISGMSFRFSIPEGKDKWNREQTERTIHEVKLYELGPVVFPAYESTSVGVRSKKIAALLKDEDTRDALAAALTFGGDGPWVDLPEGATQIDFTAVREAAEGTSDTAEGEPQEALAASQTERFLAARPSLAAPFISQLKELSQ